MEGVNRPHLYSNDRWQAEHVTQLAAVLPRTAEDEVRSAVVVGSGMMPYLLPLVRPDVVVSVDMDFRVPSFTVMRIGGLATNRTWEQYHGASKDIGDKFDAEEEFKRAVRSGLFHPNRYEQLRESAQEVRAYGVVGCLTERKTIQEVADHLEGTRPVFVNLTNVASWLRPRGPLSSKNHGWRHTKQFMNEIDIPADAAVVDTDSRLLRPTIFTRRNYRPTA